MFIYFQSLLQNLRTMPHFVVAHSSGTESTTKFAYYAAFRGCPLISYKGFGKFVLIVYSFG